jgi:hypothetical protein
MSARESILTAVLEEYKALRAEILNAVDRQYTLTNWTISGVVLLVAGLITSWHNLTNHPNVVVAVVILALPTVATMYAIAWCHVISKIDLLGWQLYHTENKIAQLFPAAEICAAYNLPAGSKTESFYYLIGWEHYLRQNKFQPLIKRAVTVVQNVLGIGYIAIIATGAYLGAMMHGLPVFKIVRRPSIVVIAVFWLIIWFALRRYLTGPANLAIVPGAQHKNVPGFPSTTEPPPR